jgi:predicted nucleic-acid-binding Zn-ribbon protein
MVFFLSKKKKIQLRYSKLHKLLNQQWNEAPIAKLNTLLGYTEIYSMDISNALIVAGQNANGFLNYNLKRY